MIRIIAGSLKGRRLDTPTWEGLRPTSDKLRETLFNVIARRVPDARVLDGFAGTGAIGIEALSRGAAHVTFIDHDPRSLKLVQQNLQRCGVSDRYVIIQTRLGGTPPLPLSQPAGSIDLAVLDPPYDEPDLLAAIATIEPLLAPGGLLVLEHGRKREAPALVGELHRYRVVNSGDSSLSFYESEISKSKI
ncbi:MAG: 16S rRNA (guanine(966)-N(2))-methyltransferase RsmD [Vicinamibacterales bacterium]|nr:16S rRNA (guanine(966)-N(2))-methyltransferase RsmD [Vicinamibacterales bacterium]